MANDKHVIMKHSLAKALMDAGMIHLDAGGGVPGAGVPGNGATNTYNSPTAANVGGPTSQGSVASLPSWTAAGITNPIGTVGGSAQGIGAAFTAQNNYQAQLAPTNDLDYTGAVNQALGNSFAGYGQAQNIQAQQQSLANQLLAQSQGSGPNPAQAALNQNTGNNIQAQAALMASQRGAGANAGLVGRQAAMQGASTQQAATGQAATLQAQQQIAAQQQLQQQQASMASGNVAEQQANNSLYGTSVAGNNTQNANTITNWANTQGINSQVAQNNANAVNKTTGGLMNGAGALAALLNKGGEVGKDGAKVELPEHLKMVGSFYHPAKYADGGGVAAPNIPSLMVQGGSDSGFDLGKSMPGKGSGGESGGMGADASGGMASMGSMFAAQGAQVPGKAKVKGNSPKNDVVPALLSPGEDVLPRSVTQAPNAPEKAAEFVRHLQERDGKKKKSGGGYGEVADSRKELEARIAALEKLVKKRGK